MPPTVVPKEANTAAKLIKNFLLIYFSILIPPIDKSDTRRVECRPYDKDRERLVIGQLSKLIFRFFAQIRQHMHPSPVNVPKNDTISVSGTV